MQPLLHVVFCACTAGLILEPVPVTGPPRLPQPAGFEARSRIQVRIVVRGQVPFQVHPERQ